MPYLPISYITRTATSIYVQQATHVPVASPQKRKTEKGAHATHLQELTDGKAEAHNWLQVYYISSS
jgi:hypothetical protein